MVKIAGVRFRGSGKIYWFDPGDLPIKAGDHVIVETVRGVEYGTVTGPVREVEEEKITQPLREVVRIATDEDEAQQLRNREKEREAMAICKAKIRKHELDMKLIDAEYTFDNNKILFYFTADGRIDFRELVKDLAGVFRTRIELRQIGVRDETKILGGIGICGRALCCHTWLTDFVPVSIKMAKEQNLSLNPTKISGVCGRLMCCLKNEEATYEYLNSKLPSVGETVTTITGAVGQVVSVSVLRQKVRVLIEMDDEKEIQEYGVEDLMFRSKKGKPRKDKEGREGGKAGHEKSGQKEEADRAFEMTETFEEETEGEDASVKEEGSSKKRRHRRNRGHKRADGEGREAGDSAAESGSAAGNERGEADGGPDRPREKDGRNAQGGQREKSEKSAQNGQREKGERNTRNGQREKGDRNSQNGQRERREKNAQYADQDEKNGQADERGQAESRAMGSQAEDSGSAAGQE